MPALGRLSDQQRTVVLLVHAFDWSQTDVATLLDISQSTVGEHLRRALVRLRRQLETMMAADLETQLRYLGAHMRAQLRRVQSDEIIEHSTHPHSSDTRVLDDSHRTSPGSLHEMKWFTVAAAVLVLVLVGGLIVTARRSGDSAVVDEPPVTEPDLGEDVTLTSTIEIGSGIRVPVLDASPVRIDGMTVYQGAPAPDMNAEIAGLVSDADELVLQPIPPDEFPIPADFPNDVDVIITIGRIGDLATAIHASTNTPDLVCTLIVAADAANDLPWTSICGGGGPVGGGGANGITTTTWPDLPVGTTLIVEIDDEGSPVRYQRPVGTPWRSRPQLPSTRSSPTTPQADS